MYSHGDFVFHAQQARDRPRSGDGGRRRLWNRAMLFGGGLLAKREAKPNWLTRLAGTLAPPKQPTARSLV